MPRSVVVLEIARQDADEMFAWIALRSPQGAARWYDTFLDAADKLANDAERHSILPNSRRLKMPVRSKPFHTRRGEIYQILFVIVDDEVRILRVRGPGQRSIRRRDLP